MAGECAATRDEQHAKHSGRYRVKDTVVDAHTPRKVTTRLAVCYES